MTFRILVTGCRDWEDPTSVAFEPHKAAHPFAHQSVVVHGACPTGADKHAADYCERHHITQDAHPADWAKLGKGAGPARNQLMAEAGAHVCLAFWDGVSAGTRDMITRAVRYGIPVRIIPKMRRA